MTDAVVFPCDSDTYFSCKNNHMSISVFSRLFNQNKRQPIVPPSIFLNSVLLKYNVERLFKGYVLFCRFTFCFCCTTETTQIALIGSSCEKFLKTILWSTLEKFAVIASTIKPRQVHFAILGIGTVQKKAFSCLPGA